MVIGFISINSEETDRLFNYFCYDNKEEIEKRSGNWARFKDGTLVKEVYDIPTVNGNYRFDQLIIAGLAAVIPSKKAEIINKIAWNQSSNIPEEYRVLTMLGQIMIR